MSPSVRIFKYILVITSAVLLSACTNLSKTSQSAGTVVVDGKEWVRCPSGQSWEGNTCVGAAKLYSFDEVKTETKALNSSGYLGRRDWRVPTVRELQSLRVCSTGFSDGRFDLQDGGKPAAAFCNDDAKKPTLDGTAFPKMLGDSNYFWSSSTHFADPREAWLVDFVIGGVFHTDRSSRMYLLLIR